MKQRFLRAFLPIALIFAMLFVPMAVFAETDNGIHMEGASIRTTGVQGLRFVGNVDRTKGYSLITGENANFGIIMVPKSAISAGAEITIKTAGIRIVPAKKLFETTTEQYRFTAVLTGIPAEYYGTELVARAYVNDNGTYLYSEQITRSIQYVADQIMEHADISDTDRLVASQVLADYRMVGNDLPVNADELWYQLVTYPEYPEQIARDYEYDVTVTQGTKSRELVVYNQTEAYFYQGRFDGGDTNRRFCEFAFAGAPVTVHIKVNRDFDTYTVAPTSKGFESSYADGVISVSMEQPEQFVLMLDGDVNTALAVFADAPESDVPAKSDSNTVYVEGWNQITYNDTGATLENGVLTLSSQYTNIYIAPGAVLTARVVTTTDSYKNKIYGRGVILDPFSMSYEYDSTTATTGRLVEFNGYTSTIQDVKLLDARCFNLYLSRGYCTAQNVKILSTRMTSDGITTEAEEGTVKDCFIYCGDNALVTQVGSGNTGYTFQNITVGTTCSVIYPQYGANSVFEDVYVFRADEGLIAMKHGTDAMNVTITNLDALDCVRTPWLFQGMDDVGSGAKTLTLNKVLMNYTTGESSASADIGTSTGAKALYRFESSNGSSNYAFHITDLYIGGNLITSQSQVKTTNAPSSFTHSYTSSGNTPAVLSGHEVAANYTCANKVMIGSRQIFLYESPMNIGGEWYLPYEEIVDYFAIAPQDSVTYLTTHGLEVISLDDLVASGAVTAAIYDSTAKAIKLTAATTNSTNLLKEDYTGKSNYNPLLYTGKTPSFTATQESGVWVYTAESASSEGGIVRMILDEYRQYGVGTYQIKFDYKCSKYSWSDKITVGIAVDHDKPNSQTYTMTTSWTSKTWTVTLSDDPADIDLMALYFNVPNGETISIRNIQLIKQ